MKKKGQEAASEIKKLLEKFPAAPVRTLATMAYEASPALWKDYEDCRKMVRYYLGLSGEKHRSNSTTLYHRPKKNIWQDVIPQPIIQLHDWGAVQVQGANKVLVLSDIHIPYHDISALEAALEYGRKRKPTIILLNGDTMDCFALSKWETDPRERNFPLEVERGKKFICGIRKMFPKARIIMKEGNHEARIYKYLQYKAPELLGLPQFEWEEIFELPKHRIEVVKEMRPIRLGKLNVLHGHEHRKTISTPVNPARGLFLRSKCHALCGHWHQNSQHSETNLEQKTITTWSTGCLCDLHPTYMPINSWSQGAAFVEVDQQGAFTVDNFRIINGKCY